jgi:signal transduction histidine kinase/FixJ family two-component response regulator
VTVPGQVRRSLPPTLGRAIIASLAALVAVAFFRLYLYPHNSVPLAYALPLLLGAWHKNRTLLWVMAGVLAAIAAWHVYLILPDSGLAGVGRGAQFSMKLANIAIVGVAVDRVIAYNRLLQDSMNHLEQANHELEASNEELAAREEEISTQNEELQSQAEELEHQNEELQQQTEELQGQSEELQQQAEELHQLSDEAAGRQRVLESLLEASTMSLSREGLEAAACRICEAALEATGQEASGGLLLTLEQGALAVLGHCGLQLRDEVQVFDDPFARTVMHERRTAAIEDLSETPEVNRPLRPDGRSVGAALAAPIIDSQSAVGAIVLYADAPRRWTQAEFKVAEWLAAQAGLVLLSARLQQEIDRRREEAEDASQRKTRFLAAVSHDVRTPANAISLTAEVIKKAGEDPRWAHEIPELAETLRSNAKLLVELVSDVLDLARFDSGKVDVDPSVFCLQDMVATEITQYQALARSAGLAIEGSSNSDGIWLQIDRMKLARVLSNLIGNAIKFTDRGRIDVRCLRADEGGVEVQVQDTGVGIQSTHLEHIFDEFYQIKNPERDRSKGTGLGLAICKRLVDAIGCSLTVESEFGRGSTFTIHIPESLLVSAREGGAPAQQQQQPQQLPAAQRLAGLRVLLVEDHEATRTAFSRLLAAQGAKVATAADGREGLQQLGHHPPDVMLLDLMLPDMDGREVLRRLVGNRPPSLKCLLAVSGDVSQERRDEVAALGADALVAKPLQIAELVDCVCDTLKRAPARGHETNGASHQRVMASERAPSP